MTLISKADLLPFIEQDDLDTISQDSDSNIDSAIKQAEEQAKEYIRHRYDIDAEFVKEGDQRNLNLVSKIIDIALFYLHKAVPSNSIPERRLFFYQEAMEWLKEVQKGKVTPDLETLKDETNTTIPTSFLYGSNTKIGTHGY